MTGRRLFFVAAVLATMTGALALMALALSPGGLSSLDTVLLILFALTLPWMTIGFWNSAIGFVLMRFSADAVAAVYLAAADRREEPVTASVAILLCVRNEIPARAVRNLEPMMDGLVRAGAGDRMHIYILSDTSDAGIAVAEAERFEALAVQWRGRIAVTYRRRTDNTGFKAGNIRDFCERWGAQHDVAITLDADSVMTAEAVLRLVRLMQRDPSLGILQGLVVGLPSTSAFARIFQFGMRLGMRSYTIGSAWWQGDCGPYWGHNAVLRLKPFAEHCQLPDRNGRHILSHDQIEAVLMRRAGYAVRVLPEEDLGWEENPPTLVEFIRRDLRWCQGNMQYWPFLTLPGLRLVSRYQLAFAIFMFIGSPAWIGLLLIGSIMIASAPDLASVVRADAALGVFVAVLVMWFSPQLATVLDVLSRSDARASFGGAVRFVVGFVVEMVFFAMLSSIMWLSHTVLLAKLPFGGGVGWGGQTRDDHTVPWSQAAHYFWPHTVYGLTVAALLAASHPAALPFALVFVGGHILSIPLAVVTSWPSVGEAFVRIGLGRLPEETAPPPVLRLLAVPAVRLAQAATMRTG